MADAISSRKTRGKNNLMILGHSMEHMRNRNEALVIEAMEKIFSESDSICKCSMCVEDVFALSLNSLRAHYQHSMSIDLHKKSNYEEAYKAVQTATQTVTKKPKHS